MPVDIGLLDRVRRARRRLAEVGPAPGSGGVRSAGGFERVSLPHGDADVLRDVLIAERARVVIEIGLAYGSSALAIAEALVSVSLATADTEDPRHVIIDAFQDRFGDAGWHALVAAGVAERSTLRRERSQLVLPRLIGDLFIADAAFVDGSHIFHNVFVDLTFLRELVRPGGLVVLDDCQWPSVATAVRYFELNTGWQPEPLTPDARLRAYRLPDPPIEPHFERFLPFGLP